MHKKYATMLEKEFIPFYLEQEQASRLEKFTHIILLNKKDLRKTYKIQVWATIGEMISIIVHLDQSVMS